MGHCEYSTEILVAPDGHDCGAEFGHTSNPLPPPQAPLGAYKDSMWSALQTGPIVILYTHLRMYPQPGSTVRPGYGAGMSCNIDKELAWYFSGGNVNNQSVPVPDNNSADLGALLYDPVNGVLEKTYDWTGCPPVLTSGDGLVLSAVNFGGSGSGAFVAIWDFDYLPMSQWIGSTN